MGNKPDPADYNVPLQHKHGDDEEQKAYRIFTHEVCTCGFQRMAHVGNAGANVIEGVECTAFIKQPTE